MEELLKTLDPHLALISYYFDDNNLVIKATRTAATANCPYCGSKSTKIHSNYVRVIHDLPVQNFVLKIILTRKIFFCDDPECEHRTFAEPLGFLKRYARRTSRLNDKIVDIAINMSARSAKKVISSGISGVSDDTIIRIIKKNKIL